MMNGKDLVVWSEIDLAPISIVEGLQKGQGYSQMITKHLHEKLPSYNHIIEENTMARSLKLLENTKYSCCSLVGTKQRAKYTIFSKPAYLIFPNGVIIRKKDKLKYSKYINENNEIDLDKLFSDEEMIFGRVNKISFGEFIDKKLSLYEYEMNISYFNKQTNLIKTFAKYERIDYIISYNTSVKYQIKNLNLENNLEYIKIKGTKIHPAYIGCSKSELGRNIINKINKFIKDHRDKEYLKYSKAYLDDEQIEYLDNNASKLFNKFDNYIVNEE